MDTENNTEINNIPHRSYTPEEISQSYQNPFNPIKPVINSEETTSYYTIKNWLLAILDILQIGFTTYWFYRNFRAIDRSQNKSAFFSLVKSVFAPFFVFQIFKKVEEEGNNLGIDKNINARVLANIYLFMNFFLYVFTLISLWVTIFKILDRIEDIKNAEDPNIYILITLILITLFTLNRFISFIPLVLSQKVMVKIKEKAHKTNDGKLELGKFLPFVFVYYIIYMALSLTLSLYLVNFINNDLNIRNERAKQRLDVLIEQYDLQKEQEQRESIESQ